MFVFDTIRMAPIITGNPAGVAIGPGGCVGALTVTAISGINDDGGPLSYQWYDSNGMLAGETADTLVTGVEGSYYCVVSNSWGEATSASARVTIVSGQSTVFAFEGGGGFTVNGSAAVHNGSLRLTEDVDSQQGSVIFDLLSTDPVTDFRSRLTSWPVMPMVRTVGFALDAGMVQRNLWRERSRRQFAVDRHRPVRQWR